MSPGMAEAFPTLAGHAAAVALCAARLLPIAYLCPLLGGLLAPTMVRLGIVLSLSLALHFEGGISAPQEVVASGWLLGAQALREVGLGTALGLVAALPLDAARMGGKFSDLFRGASAEAALPFVGTRESATGHFLYQLVLASLSLGAFLPWVLPPIWRSFSWVKVGSWTSNQGTALHVAELVGLAMGTGLAVGAPLAGVALGTDCLVGLVSRAVPQLHAQELGTPLKLLGGGAVLWWSLGWLVRRLLEDAVGASFGLGSLLDLIR